MRSTVLFLCFRDDFSDDYSERMVAPVQKEESMTKEVSSWKNKVVQFDFDN